MARHEEGEYTDVFNRRVTPPGESHRPPNAGVISRRTLNRATLVALLALCTASCNVGELQLEVVHSWFPSDDPFIGVSTIRIKANSSNGQAGPVEFKLEAHQGVLEKVPVGSDVRLTVEGIGVLKGIVSLGRTGPLQIRDGVNTTRIFFGIKDRFSYTTQKLAHRRAFHTATLLDDGSVLICGGINASWRPESLFPLPFPIPTSERFDGNSLEVIASSPMCIPNGEHADGGQNDQGLDSGAPDSRDRGAPDSGVPDSNVFDSGVPDSNVPDSGVPDSNVPDSNVPDSGAPDSNVPDSGVGDSGAIDIGFVSDGPGNTREEGCMVWARIGHSATLLESGNVFVAGGSGGRSLIPDVEIFEPSSGRFISSRMQLIEPRWMHQAGISNTSVLLVGGAGKGQLVSISESFTEGNEATNSESGVKARRAHAMTRLEDGKLLVSGGIGSSGVLSTLEIWNPKTSKWQTNVPHMVVPRAYHSATLMEDGSVLFTGGLTSLSGKGMATDIIERFDTKTNKIYYEKRLTTPRWAHTTTLLTNGRVIVAGGFTVDKNSAPTRTVDELWIVNGRVAQVRPFDAMQEPRAGHTATRLKSGFVLFVGGMKSTATAGLEALNNAEVYVY